MRESIHRDISACNLMPLMVRERKLIINEYLFYLEESEKQQNLFKVKINSANYKIRKYVHIYSLYHFDRYNMSIDIHTGIGLVIGNTSKLIIVITVPSNPYISQLLVSFSCGIGGIYRPIGQSC